MIPLKDLSQYTRFFVIGDWGREGSLEQQQTAAQMARQAEILKPDFIVSTGDNFYDSGVISTNDPLWETCFERVYFHDALQIPWYCVLGNHDYGGSTAAQLRYGKKHKRWNMPAHYYARSFSIGEQSLKLIFTDTTPLVQEYWETESYPELPFQNPQTQLCWLEQQLAESEDTWKIVVGHHPVFSSSPMHGDTDELVRNFYPLFQQHQVDAYLCGHEHDLQLQQADDKGTIYVVSGAGSEIRETDRKDMTLFSHSACGFASICLNHHTMQVQFIDSQGDQLYSYESDAKSSYSNEKGIAG